MNLRDVMEEFSRDWVQKEKEFTDRFKRDIWGEEPEKSFKERVEDYEPEEEEILEEVEEPEEIEDGSN